MNNKKDEPLYDAIPPLSAPLSKIVPNAAKPRPPRYSPDYDFGNRRFPDYDFEKEGVDEDEFEDDLDSFLHVHAPDSLDSIDERDAELNIGEWGRFGSGIVNDLKRKLPYYKSDWTDGFQRKTLSACLFLYFACLAPTIAFGGLTNILTEGTIGVVEFIVSCGLSGMIYAVFSGQPMTFLGPTGLTLAFTSSLFSFTKAAGLPFLSLYSWTGLWTSLFLLICSLTNTSNLIKICTRFTDDCFNAILAINFLNEAVKSLLKNFLGPTVDVGSALASANLAFFTWLATRKVVHMRRTKLFNYQTRKVISDFGPTAVLIAMSLFASHPAISKLGIECLAVPSSFTISPRPSWLADLLAVPTNMKILSIVPALLLTMLFWLDQNISVRAVNTCDLKKGEAYHWDMLVLSVIVGGLSVCGLPWTCAATVQSLNHVRAMADIDHRSDGSERLTNIVETRVSGFAIHSLILATVFLLPYLAYIPIPVISGLFLYLGRKLMKGNLYFDRIGHLFHESHESSIKLLRPLTSLRFLGIQTACIGTIWYLKQSQKLALFFPSCIAGLMACRCFILPKLFTKKELVVLDPLM